MHFFTGDRNNHLINGISKDNINNFSNFCCTNSSNNRHIPCRRIVCINAINAFGSLINNRLVTNLPFPYPLSPSPLSSPLLPLTLSYNSPIIPSTTNPLTLIPLLDFLILLPKLIVLKALIMLAILKLEIVLLKLEIIIWKI